MEIVAAVPVRNRENFIGAYLDMLLDLGIRPIVTFGVKSWANHADDESIKPDLTEHILDNYFKNVKVLKGTYSHHRDSINECTKNAGQYDLIIVNDCDMFITRNDWGEFLKFVNDNNSYEVYSANFASMFVEYYYDYRFGKPAIPGGDYPLIAMRPMVEFRHMTKATSNNEIVWDIEGPKFHHMRFCKKNRIDRRCYIPVDTADYTHAPEEISNRLIQWQSKIQSIK